MRVIVPEDLREPVLSVLRSAVGVANLLVYPGAALEPVGDEITADIARECANDVIKELKALDVQHRGAITLQPLDTVLSTRAHRAEDDAEGDPADAVVWDELIGRTREEATLSVTFVLFLTLACLLAAIGVVTDSTVTVVGAMVLGPEFGPLAAHLRGAGAAAPGIWPDGHSSRCWSDFPVAMIVTAAATMAVEAAGWLTLDTVRNIHEVDFIFQVGPLSFVGIAAGRRRGHVVTGVVEVGGARRRVHLGHDGARRRVRSGGGHPRRLGRWPASRPHSWPSTWSAS